MTLLEKVLIERMFITGKGPTISAFAAVFWMGYFPFLGHLGLLFDKSLSQVRILSWKFLSVYKY